MGDRPMVYAYEIRPQQCLNLKIRHRRPNESEQADFTIQYWRQRDTQCAANGSVGEVSFHKFGVDNPDDGIWTPCKVPSESRLCCRLSIQTDYRTGTR